MGGGRGVEVGGRLVGVGVAERRRIVTLGGAGLVTGRYGLRQEVLSKAGSLWPIYLNLPAGKIIKEKDSVGVFYA